MPMRQLRSCDFCGDDAAGVYEVLPPALSPTEAEQHRVVLCADCVGTLEAVVNPLLRRLGVDTEGSDATAEPEDSEPAPNAAADPPSRPPNATGGSSTPPERSPTGGEPTGGPDRPAEPSGGGTEAPDHDDTGPRAGDGPSPAGAGADHGDRRAGRRPNLGGVVGQGRHRRSRPPRPSAPVRATHRTV